ncbi:MAG: PspC domain-containing protein [Bacteroidota bacterium]
MYRKLYRSRKDNMIAGVAGGLANYFEIDPAILRLIFIITTFISGIGLIAYIVLWIVVPYEDMAYAKTYTVEPDGTTVETGTGTAETGSAEAGDVKNTETEVPNGTGKYEKRKDSRMLGVVLIALGVIFLAENFLPFFSFWDYWPLLLIGIGAWLLLKSSKN